MPMEIWDMLEIERDLPTPTSNVTLDKLSRLVGVSAKSCTIEIFKRITNLKDLGIQMQLKPYDEDDDCNPLSGLDNISKLQSLDSIAYFVVNPGMKYMSLCFLFQCSLQL